MTTLNVRVDESVKKEASVLFNDLGLDLSTAVNIFLRQSIMRGGLPFDVVKETPNAETIAAIEEVEEMKKHPENYKHYKSMAEIWADIEDEEV